MPPPTPAEDDMAEAAAAFDTNIYLGPPREIGSLLLSLSFVLTSGMCFLTAVAIKKMGHYWVILCGYVGVALFLTCHFLPTYVTLIPGYIVLGLVYGPLCISKLNLVFVMANKLSCGQHECCNAGVSTTPTLNPSATGVMVGGGGDTGTLTTDEQHSILFATKPACSRDENIRRLARWFHASHNFGIICGALLAALLLTCAAFHAPGSVAHTMCMGANKTPPTSGWGEQQPAMPYAYMPSVASDYKNSNRSSNNNSELPPTQLTEETRKNQTQQQRSSSLLSNVVETPTPTPSPPPPAPPVVAALLSMGVERFDTNNHGQRICGAASCPVWWVHPSLTARGLNYHSSADVNITGSDSILHRVAQPRKSSMNMRIQGIIVVYLILAVLTIGFTVASGKLNSKKNHSQQHHHHQHANRYNSIPGLVDTMFFAGPMAYFIGTEQGYILADFMKVIIRLLLCICI